MPRWKNKSTIVKSEVSIDARQRGAIDASEQGFYE
jgi:hypothetical protein